MPFWLLLFSVISIVNAMDDLIPWERFTPKQITREAYEFDSIFVISNENWHPNSTQINEAVTKHFQNFLPQQVLDGFDDYYGYGSPNNSRSRFRKMLKLYKLDTLKFKGMMRLKKQNTYVGLEEFIYKLSSTDSLVHKSKKIFNEIISSTDLSNSEKLLFVDYLLNEFSKHSPSKASHLLQWIAMKSPDWRFIASKYYFHSVSSRKCSSRYYDKKYACEYYSLFKGNGSFYDNLSPAELREYDVTQKFLQLHVYWRMKKLLYKIQDTQELDFTSTSSELVRDAYFKKSSDSSYLTPLWWKRSTRTFMGGSREIDSIFTDDYTIPSIYQLNNVVLNNSSSAKELQNLKSVLQAEAIDVGILHNFITLFDSNYPKEFRSPNSFFFETLDKVIHKKPMDLDDLDDWIDAFSKKAPGINIEASKYYLHIGELNRFAETTPDTLFLQSVIDLTFSYKQLDGAPHEDYLKALFLMREGNFEDAADFETSVNHKVTPAKKLDSKHQILKPITLSNLASIAEDLLDEDTPESLLSLYELLTEEYPSWYINPFIKNHIEPNEEPIDDTGDFQIIYHSALNQYETRVNNQWDLKRYLRRALTLNPSIELQNFIKGKLK